MNTGKKIKIIREFRKKTQAELAAAIGLGAKAQARIGQYESGYRIPKKRWMRSQWHWMSIQNRYMSRLEKPLKS